MEGKTFFLIKRKKIFPSLKPILFKKEKSIQYFGRQSFFFKTKFFLYCKKMTVKCLVIVNVQRRFSAFQLENLQYPVRSVCRR